MENDAETQVFKVLRYTEHMFKLELEFEVRFEVKCVVYPIYDKLSLMKRSV
jgi:hypothetical protein